MTMADAPPPSLQMLTQPNVESLCLRTLYSVPNVGQRRDGKSLVDFVKSTPAAVDGIPRRVAVPADCGRAVRCRGRGVGFGQEHQRGRSVIERTGVGGRDGAAAAAIKGPVSATSACFEVQRFGGFLVLVDHDGFAAASFGWHLTGTISEKTTPLLTACRVFRCHSRAAIGPERPEWQSSRVAIL